MSESSSPPQKRRRMQGRMSSPTYDEQLALPSQDELRAIGKLEFSLSQAPSHYRGRTSNVPPAGTASQDRFGLEHESHSCDIPIPALSPASCSQQHPVAEDANSDDPFTSKSGPLKGFITASAAHSWHPAINRRPPDPETGQSEGDITEERVEGLVAPDTSASDIVTPSVGFAAASTLVRQPVSITHHDSPFQPLSKTFGDAAQTEAQFDSFGCMLNNGGHELFSAFTSLGRQKNLFQPSAAAIKIAQERAKRWAAEDDDLVVDQHDDTAEKTPDVSISPRQDPIPVGNISLEEPSKGPTVSESAKEAATASVHRNVTYSVAGTSSIGQVGSGGTFQSATHFSTPSALEGRSFQTRPALGIKGNAATKPFKPPLLSLSATRNSGSTQHAPSLLKTVASTPTRGSKPAALDSFSGLVNTPGSRFSTPLPMRGTPMRKAHTKKFVTPFKPGMRPGEAGHRQLQARYDAERANNVSGPSTEGASSKSDASKKRTRQFFDFTVVQDRKSLASSGFRPGLHGLETLTNMGIDVAELCDLTPKSALQHRFRVSHQGIPRPDPVPSHLRGPTDALGELKEIGCHLATQDWVDNHWSLILWKLAGIVALDPESELDADQRRWSWAEMMRQLRYRYERELNRGARPALRLIAAQDALAGLHMVLCVSGIVWSASGIGDDGLPLVPHPTLELTDGWYRLRAQVDEVLARATRRGVIRVGRKIAVSGASLPRNTEPCEVLEAYDKVELNIAGNGTHLAPWYTKLGFQALPAVSTLHTLSPEGGIVPCLHLVVTKVYPIAFIEFRKDTDGKVTREGPRREKEELAVHDAWTRKRDRECQRLRKETEDKQRLFLDWAQRFEVRSGGSWQPGDDEDMPEHIESMFDDCEYSSDPSSVLRRASKTEAGWLARFARERAEQEREALEQGLERELQSACPPREVRNFRVLLMRDARTNRRPARRVVELTAWDVLSLGFDGVGAGHLVEGQRFQVSSLCVCMFGRIEVPVLKHDL
ncbi:hypothetical protein BC826DRAFT_714100 [Russula brevipes]|nr:hypothetical protein BC826DRAFT_714100 [Russula brevipes]